MKAFIWLSFDLGVRGDFDGMYQFLDAHGTKERGGSLAALSFEYKGFARRSGEGSAGGHSLR